MRKKFLTKVVLATVLASGINLLPMPNFDTGNVQISVAYAESKNFAAKEAAMTDVEIIEAQAKEASRLRAIEAVKEKIASYVRNFSGAKGKLNEDDIAAIAEKFEEVGTAQYKKLFYNAVDEEGKELGKVGIMYEATVTAKFNSKKITEYIKLTEQEKERRIRQAREAREHFEELDREYEELRKNARTKTPEQLQSDIKIFDDKISDFEKSREKNNSSRYKIDNNQAEEYNKRGLYYKEQKNYSEAIKNFDKAIELKPNYTEAYNNRGVTYSRFNINDGLKQYDKAISDFNKAIELNPNYVAAYNNRGRAYLDLSTNRGVGYINLQQLNKAIFDFNKAIELNPNYVEAYIDRGYSYLNLTASYEFNNNHRAHKEQYAKPMADFNKAIQLNPNYALSYIARGDAYYDLNQYEAAVADYNKAIQINPNAEEACLSYDRLCLLYQTYTTKNSPYFDFGKAMEAINNAIKINPNESALYWRRSTVFMNYYSQSQGIDNIQNALNDISKAIELLPSEAQYYKIRGDYYKELGEIQKANADFAKAKQLGYK